MLFLIDEKQPVRSSGSCMLTRVLWAVIGHIGPWSMIAKISAAHSFANPESRNRGRSSPHAFVFRIGVAVEMELPLQRKEVSPHSQPPASPQTARQARIAILKHAVENGTYNISAEQITDKMLTATLVDLLV